jgi:hypothetical protein
MQSKVCAMSLLLAFLFLFKNKKSKALIDFQILAAFD